MPRPGRLLPAWRQALVVVAHPDDETFGLGAVADRFTAGGTAVQVLCFTHGEASTLNENHAELREARAALRELRADGIVVAERGRRPRLTGPARSPSRWARCTRSSPRRPARPGGVPPLFHLERFRLAGGEPLALDTVWLPAEIAAPLLEADFTHTASYDELAARTGTGSP